mgnify:CR=1 FL=1
MKVSKNIFSLSTVLLVLCLVGFSSCDDECFDERDPLCENYDPCWDWVEPNFQMGNTGFYYDDVKEASDTVLFGVVYFEAKVADALEYTWKIGTDSRTWNTSQFTLNFRKSQNAHLRDSPILVTLIVKRALNTKCVSDDDGIDTLSRHLHFRYDVEAAFWGDWEGYIDDETDNIYQLRVEQYFENGSSFPNMKIYNQYGEGEDCYHEYSSTGFDGFYRHIHARSQGTAENWEECGGSPYRRWNRGFTAEVNTTENSIVIKWFEWYYKDAGTGECCEQIPHTFRGRLIQ